MILSRGFMGFLRAHVLNIQFIFVLTVISIFIAKAVHIAAHIDAVPTPLLKSWSWSFLGQDYALVLLLYALVEQVWSRAQTGRAILTNPGLFPTCFSFAICIANVTFFVVSGGVEIHWRNVFSASDPGTRALLLSGLGTFLGIISGMIVAAVLTQHYVYTGVGFVYDSMLWLVRGVWSTVASNLRSNARYEQLPFDSKPNRRFTSPKHLIRMLPETILAKIVLLFRILFSLWLLTNLIAVFIRPADVSIVIMCWTTPMLPFVEMGGDTATILANLERVYKHENEVDWDQVSAAQTPPSLEWLAKDKVLPGFEDWYNNKTHYTASADPLHVSNLQQDLLPNIRKALSEIDIRHVMIFMLESTRKDVFPIKKDSFIWNHIAETFPSKKLPDEAVEMLSKLTPNANFITGEYDDGFKHDSQPKRGGISFNNAFSTSSFTLKSIAGTNCGITPIAADFGLDAKYHIYQPCLPHIFNALTELNSAQHNANKSAPLENWRTSFMQTATFDYENFGLLIDHIGYNFSVDREYLRSDDARFGKVELEDVYYFGFEEPPLIPYIRQQFSDAKKANERVFLTHITMLTHHPFRMPEGEPYVEVAGGSASDDYLSGYLNTIGYSDRWIGTVLKILEDEGVANETLIIFQGDHGHSLPENGMVGTYYNPKASTFHVPLVISHPHLPVMHIDDAVNADQVLPTVLDVLLESDSLTPASREAVKDLIKNYEGQSLIREPVHTTPNTNQGNWQFSIPSPGNSMVVARDSRHKDMIMVVPIIVNQQWHLGNLTSDPTDMHGILDYDYGSFLQQVESRHGKEVALWAEEGAFAVRWWIEDLMKRWRYGPYKE